jgi:hypothetical protein
MGRLLTLTLALLFLIEVSTTIAFAQQSDSTDSAIVSGTPKIPPSATQIEEITVIGIQSLNNMRARIEYVEDEIYTFFNANNSSNRMDIVCSKRRPTGTNMLKRECEPRFLVEMRVLKTREAQIGIGVDFNQEDLVGWSRADFEVLQSEMLDLIAKHPEFSDKLAQLSDLVEDYAAKAKEVIGDDQ